MTRRNTRWLGVGVLALALLVSVPAAVEAKVYRLYYLGGQSNMVGSGSGDDIPEAERATSWLPSATRPRSGTSTATAWTTFSCRPASCGCMAGPSPAA